MISGMFTEARDAYARSGRLFEVHIDLLYQCDLDCVHCYLDEKSVRLHPTVFWKGVIDQVAELGAFHLQLSGGELFIRPDSMELIAHARSRGLFVHLKTHAGHLDGPMITQLADLGVSSVFVSYYSVDPVVHDAITQRPGSHANTRAALGLLAASGIHTIAVIPVMQSNAPSVAATLTECADLGVSVKVDGEIRMANGGSSYPRDAAMDAATHEALEAQLAGQSPSSCASGESVTWGDGANCSAGVIALYIGPTGDVTPCVTWPMSLGNLAKGDRLDAIWAANPKLTQARALRRRDRPVCQDCALRSECGYCLGQSYIEGQDPLVPARTVCETTRAKARASALRDGRPMPPDPPPLVAHPFQVLSPTQGRSVGRLGS